MPEEINRLATDAISDLLLTPSRDGDENLRREGHREKAIAFVGNCMIDSLQKHVRRAKTLDVLQRLDVVAGKYACCTLHRPSNVDDPTLLATLIGVISEISAEIPVIFPVHPRTRKNLPAALPKGIRLCEPFGYLEFLALTSQSALVMTDSGGLQEETTVLGVPCLTLRENTERPVTVTEGTNTIVGTDPERIRQEARRVLAGNGKKGRIPEGWDGKAAVRVIDAIERF